MGEWLDIANYLAAMKSIATNHFTTGAPLVVPSDIVNYLATLERHSPAGDLRHGQYLRQRRPLYFFGRVYCGSLDLTIPSPFYTLSELYYNTNKGAEVTIYYSPADFQNAELKALASKVPHTYLTNFFASGQWNSLTNLAATQDRTGFFVAVQPLAQAPEWSLVLSDADGNPVDEMPFLSTRSGGTTAPTETGGSPSVSVAVAPSPGKDAVGIARTVALQVTNQSPLQPYGTAVSLKLADNCDFLGASGSQGYASYDPATRVVSYTVGPLIGGASADIALQLIPLQSGLVLPAGPALLALGGGLTNSSPDSTAAFAPIETVPPDAKPVARRRGNAD